MTSLIFALSTSNKFIFSISSLYTVVFVDNIDDIDISSAVKELREYKLRLSLVWLRVYKGELRAYRVKTFIDKIHQITQAAEIIEQFCDLSSFSNGL